MDTSRRVSGYDLFKLTVAILLLILFFLLLRRPAVEPLSAAATEFPPTEIAPLNAAPTLQAQPILVTTSATSPAETATDLPSLAPTGTMESATATSLPTSSPSSTTPDADAPSSTPLPSPTGTPVTESTPSREPSSTSTACEDAASRSRVRAGMSAVILRRLNFRSSPGIQNNWLLTNIPGTQVRVVGGPACVPHLTGAYIWWQIELPDGSMGWSAEGSIHGAFYFMEPVQ